MTHVLGHPGSMEAHFGISLNVSQLPQPKIAPVVEGIAHQLQVVRSVYAVEPTTLEFTPPEQVGKVLDTRELAARHITATDIGRLGVDMAIVSVMESDWRRRYDDLSAEGVATGLAIPNGLSKGALAEVVEKVLDLPIEAPARLVVKGDMPKVTYSSFDDTYNWIGPPQSRWISGAIDQGIVEHTSKFGRHHDRPQVVRPDFYFEQPDAILAGYSVAPSNVRMIMPLDVAPIDTSNIAPLAEKIAAQAAAVESHLEPETARSAAA